MNSATPLLAHYVDHAPAQAAAVSAPWMPAQGVGGDIAARTDRTDPEPHIESTETDETHNPLWPVAIGTAFLFSAMAAVMVFS
jgi:hypothetical protein